MSYENGRKLTLLGFGLNLLVNILFILSLFISFNAINTILSCGQYLSIGVAALGFLLMWLADKEMIDLLSCGATGIAAFLGLLNSVGIINTGSQFGNIIFPLYFRLSTLYWHLEQKISIYLYLCFSFVLLYTKYSQDYFS